MASHAKLGPSSAARWLECTASVVEAAKYPNVASEPAAQGTYYHELVSLGLELGLDPTGFLGNVMRVDGFEIECDEDMVSHAEQAIEMTLERLPGELFVETKVALDRWMPGQWGTLDVGAFDEEFIYIHDEKYGAGVAVSPVNNPQIMLYALGFWNDIAKHKTSATKFILSINQPRNGAGGGIWETTLADLLTFGKTVKRKIAEIEDDPEFVPGAKQCQFCPAKNGCSAFAEFNLALLDLCFEDLDMKTSPDLPEQMTPERRSYIVQNSSMITSWLKTLHNGILTDALSGETETPGFKAVHGNAGRRAWKDQQAAEAALSALTDKDIFVKKLLSPAVAQKLVGTKKYDSNLAKYITRPEPKPILVPEQDKRPALKGVFLEFEDLTEE